MTVLELKELLNDAPDDMQVMIGDTTELGMFAFTPACICDSGVIELGPAEEEDESEWQGKIFAILPHGLAIQKGEEPDEYEVHPQLN